MRATLKQRMPFLRTLDDIQYGGDSVEELTKFKDQATEIMKEEGLTLHKWHSNVASMESTVVEKGREEEDGVKQRTNHDEKLRNTSKILGIQWDKEEDLLQMNFKSCFQSDQPVTKRKMLAVINGILDLLGWVSPVSITAKILFSELCLEKVSWDENLPEDVQRRWNNDQKDLGNSLMQKFSYWKLLRVTALVKRFADNCRGKEKRKGPITTEEISSAENIWLRFAQENQELNSPMELRKDDMGVWRCFGRVPGYHPAFLPRKSLLSTRIIQHCHKATVHRGVQSTMVKVREQFWIPQLRQMVKAVCFKCNGCKKHRAKGMPSRGVAALPSSRAEFCEPFATTGVDFAGHKANKKQIKKACIVLFTCSSTRAVHITLCKDMTTEEFKKTLKWFVARRGKPHLMVSDNAKTFAATKKWLESLQNSEEINGYLASQSIKWSFNLSRAPWWGGFFERLIGVMKSALSKVIGNTLLSFTELEETLLGVECFMNNRPLTYLGEEFDKQVNSEYHATWRTSNTLGRQRGDT